MESRLRIRIADNEFEAEGSEESVQRQFEAFKRLIAQTPGSSAGLAPTATVELEPNKKTPALELGKIISVRGRIVSLVVPAKLDEALLVLLLGQREIRRNEFVNGVEVMNGLRESGFRLPRADNIMIRLAKAGDVIATGIHRTRRYRLSNAGIEKAQQIAQQLLSKVPLA